MRWGGAVGAAASVTMLVAAIGWPGAADAAWPGTPGRIAWLDANSGLHVIDDTPGGTGTAIDVVGSTVNTGTPAGTPPTITGVGGPGASAPAWSPDGTKLAFASKVADTGIGHGATHMAIFVWKVETGEITQITTPPAGYPDCGGASPCDVVDGYAFSDVTPAWKPDGTAIAFVRTIAAGKDSSHYGERGGDVWQVSLTGGGASRMTTVGTNNFVTALAWGGDPDGQTALVGLKAVGGDKANVTLDRLDGGDSTLLGVDAVKTMADYDVSADGTHVDWLKVTSGSITSEELGVNGGATRSLGSVTSSYLRASPTGNGPLVYGFGHRPSGAQAVGLFEHQAHDSDRDQWSEDPPDRFLFPTRTFAAPASTAGRRAWDVQPLHLPIIAIPGFAGSKLYCNGAEDWPIAKNPSTNATSMHELALDASGASPNCAGSGPNGDPEAVGGIVTDVFGGVKAIYQPLVDFMTSLVPHDQERMFSWDWRRSPEDNVPRLKGEVDHLLDSSFARRQGAHQVVLYAHSYGGLLIRQYVEDHPKDVARVLTAGTPYWGAPKVLFAVAFGIENPLSGILDLDTFIPNDAMKEFMVHNRGAYHLLPSEHYGPWLDVSGSALDHGQTTSWLTGVGGDDGALIGQGWAWHADHDGFFTADGDIDMRAVIGRGSLTITGETVPAAAGPGGEVPVVIRLGDGDGTVPATSASQGSPGTHDPLGDDVHVQTVCRVEHMPLPGDPKVTDAYADYLVHGRVPVRTTPGRCAPSGSAVEVRNLDVTPGARSARAASEPLTLFDAWYDGHIQLVPLPGAPVAITSDDDPVSLRVGRSDAPVEITIRHVVDGVEGPADHYPPLTGDVVVSTGPSGTVVTLDGAPVAPLGAGSGTAAPGPTPDGGAPATSASGDAGPAPAGATAAPSGGAATPTPLAVRLSGHRSLRAALRRGLRVRGTCPAACTLRLQLRADAATARTLHLRGRALALAAGRASARRAGPVTVVLRFGPSARRTLRHARKVGASVRGTATLSGGTREVRPLPVALRR